MPAPDAVLERLKVAIEQELATEFIKRSPSIEWLEDYWTERFRMQFRMHVLGQRHPVVTTEHSIAWAETRWATWWDHFKDTYRSRWWLRALVRRRPVCYVSIPHTRRVTLDVEAYRTFPQDGLRWPEELGPEHRWVQTSTREEGWHSW